MTENQLLGLAGSALKVSVVVWCGWASPLLCQSQLELRLCWAVTLGFSKVVSCMVQSSCIQGCVYYSIMSYFSYYTQ
jgi:hypothetical protein